MHDRGSRFRALLKSASNAEQAASYRREVAQNLLDATHHCWAERIGWPATERSSDAGEPRGTAGEPIARVLRSNELSDVVAIVVRWFGGIKLGKGGLARAYAGAVASALEGARLEQRFPMFALRVRMSYDKVGAVQGLAGTHAGEWLEASYGAEVEARLRLPVDAGEAVREALADLRVEILAEEEDRW